LKTGVAALGAAGTIAAGFYALDDHYQRKSDADEHAREDDVRSLYAQRGIAQLRQSIVEDKVFDLATRKATSGGKFPPTDEVILQRYSGQLDKLNSRLDDLQKQIDDALRKK
jgi:hypothetical protein